MLPSYICGVFLLTFVWPAEATVVVKKKVAIGIEPYCTGTEKSLLCADPEEKKIYKIDLETNEYVSTDILCGIPHVILQFKDKGAIVAIDQLLYIYIGVIGGDGVFKLITALDERKPDNYIGGCAIDSEGSVYCATNTPTNETRTLYIIKEKAWPAFRPFDYGNCFTFSADSKYIFFIDVKVGVIYRYNYNIANGGISNPTKFFDIGTLSFKIIGKPTCIVVDIKGNLFLAVGDKIVKISVFGQVVSIITLPVKVVLSLTFAGKNMGNLYAVCVTETNAEIYAITGLGTSGIKLEVVFNEGPYMSDQSTHIRD